MDPGPEDLSTVAEANACALTSRVTNDEARADAVLS